MNVYLVSSIILGFIWLVLYCHRSDLRYEILFVSILFLPFGLTQALFVPEYWNPLVIYKFFGLFDIESLMLRFLSEVLQLLFMKRLSGTRSLVSGVLRRPVTMPTLFTVPFFFVPPLLFSRSFTLLFPYSRYGLWW